MSKTTRKVTVDTSRRPSAEGTTSSADTSSKTRKKSVFERLGTAGSSYESESSRNYSRDGNNFGPSVGAETKKSKKEKYNESDDGMYQDTDRSPESKKEKRRLQDGERLKIEFKKDNMVKKKHTISALYEEEVSIRKMKKEREKREKELHAKHKLGEGVMITKDENFRNIQIKVDEKKERKSKFETKDDEDSQSETSSSKKHKKKRKHEEIEEDVKERTEILPKKKKKKKEKSRHESSSSDSESEREKKRKNKKDRYKSYESEDSVNEVLKKKSKNCDHEDVDDKKAMTETKRKKKKKKEKYESESEESSEREGYYGRKEKIEKGYDIEKVKKSRKAIEEDPDIVKKKKVSEGKKQRFSPGFKKESHKGKERSRRSASYSSLSSGSSLGEEDENIDLQKRNRKKRDQDIDKEHRFDKKSKERKRDKHQDERDSQIQDDGRDMFVDERRKDLPPENYQRDHHSQHAEPRYEHWERDRPAHEQSSHYGSPYYGRPRGPEPYRPRYEPPVKGSSDRERAGYRQYPDGGYGSDQGRYRDRGNRDSYPYQGNRRSGGYVGEDEGYPPGGRSRDSFAGAQDPQQNYAREDKQGQRYRDHQSTKIDLNEFDERGRRKSGHRTSRERKEYGSKSPVSKRRSRSPKDVGKDTSKDKLKSKKRKRTDDSPPSEKDHSGERKTKKSKGEIKSDSEKESNTEADPKAEKGKKYAAEADKRDGGRRSHREVAAHQKRDDFPDDKRDRKADKSKGHEKERERGSERDRERDRKSKGSSSGDRSKTVKVQSKTEKRSDTPSNEDARLEKAEDRRVSSLKTSNRHSSPSRRSDSESGSKSQKKKGRSGQDGQDVNLDDVYEKISDDELDFFDEENSKTHKPASLEDLDWSALSSIAPPTKKDSESGQTHRSKHSGISVLKSIGFSSKLLGAETVKSIQKNLAESEPQHGANGSEEVFQNGTAALIAGKIESRKNLKDLIAHLATDGAILSMRKDINIRKELRIPENRLSASYNLYSSAPTAPPDKELLLASTSIYKKIIPGESEPAFKTIPSLLGSIVLCTNG